MPIRPVEVRGHVVGGLSLGQLQRQGLPFVYIAQHLPVVGADPETVLTSFLHAFVSRYRPSHRTRYAAMWRSCGARRFTASVRRPTASVYSSPSWRVLRSSSHLLEARAERQNTMSIHHRYAGHTPEPFVGGLALSLDLTQAFDRLRRDILVSALQEAQVPAPYICLIVAWHQDAKYHILHAGQELDVDAQQGVRQGCLLAPLIFACATGYLLKRLPDHDGHDWLKSLTVYADDF